MASLPETIRQHGGLAATHELLTAGFHKRSLAAAVNRGSIIRVRQGWYCTPELDHTVQQGIRVGGRLGCVSGGAQHQMWLPPRAGLHVSLAGNDCRLRTPNDMRMRLATSPHRVTTHWSTIERTGSRLVLDPLDCLAEASLCQPVEYTVAMADTAMRGTSRRGPLLSLEEWRKLARLMPTRARILHLADGVCESGTESITWVRLSRLRLPIRRQVWLWGKRVDFLVGRRLVIEVDGQEYHVDPVRFEADRTRDAELCARDFIVLRFSYRQVIYRWHQVERAVLAAVARGDHL